MSASPSPYPIGVPGIPWGSGERATWLSRQVRQRAYAGDVVSPMERLSASFEMIEYGQLEYPPDRYRLLALRSRAWVDGRPVALITGGVHGYETSGVHGALQFAATRAAQFVPRINLLIVPCVSPWAYERVHRWNADAIDPNRSFRAGTPVVESAALMQLIAPMRGQFLVHVDLHETTDTDETEYGPALAARDGKPSEPGITPDGFYLVDDSENPRPDFQRAVIEAVAKVTHIAPADENGQIIGSALVAPGVIRYPLRELGLCTGITGARFTTITEVYPDSPRVSAEQCNAAQVAAVCAALDFALRL